MPRTSREISGTGIYHVMLRGINKQDIFDDEDDFLHFIQILHSLVDRHDEQGACLPPYCTIYAYCLMSNHVHLLIREKEENLREFVNTPVETPGVLDIDSKSAGKLTDEEVEEKLVELSGGSSPHDIKKMKRPERDRMLKQICELGANPRQVSRITGISYGVIFKAKK